MVDILELLAEIEHDQWIEWSKTISKQEKISDDRLKRWKDCWVPYKDLSEEMKEFDRKYARKVLKVLNKDSIKEHSIKEDGEGGGESSSSEIGNTVGSGGFAGLNQDPFRPVGFLGKYPIFKIPSNTFNKFRLAKIKNKKWKSFFENSDYAEYVSEFSKKYPKTSILGQCEKTNALTFIKKVD